MSMTRQQFLAVDLGAESGRGVLGTFDGERLTLGEIGRFPTGRGAADMCPDGVQRWQFDRILAEIKGLSRSASRLSKGELAGIGVDSWAVDFGLLDSSGALLAPPVCYRDRSHAIAMKAVVAQVPQEEIWDATGIQGLPFNTLYQLAAMQAREPSLLDQANCLLMIPDLIHYLLMSEGQSAVEVTNGSTTQMMRPSGQGWNTDLLDRLGLPSHFLKEITQPGIRIGETSTKVPIYAPATHDTASAVAAVPADGSAGSWAFLSSGTWSLIGAELPEPNLSHEALHAGFSNELGVQGKTRFLKNIMGLWLVQQVRESLCRTEMHTYTYADLAEMAAQAGAGSIVDAVDQRFLNPRDMVQEIKAACRDSRQPEPRTVGDVVRCCMDSLALAYRRALRQLSSLTGETFEVLHIVGGGTANQTLNQWTADACGIPVLAGPGEATALGNILGQVVAAGLVPDWSAARELSRRSFSPTLYTPNADNHALWAEREAKALKSWEGTLK